jgi:site-specific recombinase XerD
MKTTEDFIEFQRANGLKNNTLINIKSKFDVASTWKPIPEWEDNDVIKYFGYMRKKGYKQSYIEMTKSLLKRYFKWIGKENFVKDMKVKFPEIKLKATDILTPDDIDKMIQAASLNRDKALISSLFESGARISELIAVRVKDLQATPQGLKILIHGTKTGEEYRPCLLIYSGQYLKNHILYPPVKPDERIFDFTKQTAYRIVKDAAKKAEITKPVSPHKLRHAQATYMTRKGYQESIIRQKLGWTGDSAMIARYTHLDGNDIINATIEKEGGSIQELPKELIKPITMAKPIEISDASLDINRLQSENEALKTEMETMRKDMEKIQKFIKMGGMELISDKGQYLRH